MLNYFFEIANTKQLTHNSTEKVYIKYKHSLLAVPSCLGRSHGWCMVVADVVQVYYFGQHRPYAQGLERRFGTVQAYSLWSYFHSSLYAFAWGKVSLFEVKRTEDLY